MLKRIQEMNCSIIITILLVLCLESTLQMAIKSFFHILYYLLISFQSRLCDRSDSTLVIDSAVAYHSKAGLKVMLFSGDQFYESESVDIPGYPMDFTVKSIKELNETLEPPIENALKPIGYSEVDLCLINVSNIIRDMQGILTSQGIKVVFLVTQSKYWLIFS